MYTVLSVFDKNEIIENISPDITVICCRNYSSGLSIYKKSTFDLVIINSTNDFYSSFLIASQFLSEKQSPIWLVSKSLDPLTYMAAYNMGITNILPKFDDKHITNQLIITYFSQLNNYNIQRINKKKSIIIDKLTLNIDDASIQFLDGDTITLQQKQFEILYYFMQNVDKLVTIEEIWSHCWNEIITNTTKDSCLNTLHNHIFRLRGALSLASAHYEEYNAAFYVSTVKNKGYKFLPMLN